MPVRLSVEYGVKLDLSHNSIVALALALRLCRGRYIVSLVYGPLATQCGQCRRSYGGSHPEYTPESLLWIILRLKKECKEGREASE